MASQLNHSATLRIGATISSSFRAAVGGISGATTRIQEKVKGLKDTQRELVGSLRAAESAAHKMGVTGSASVAKLEGEHRGLAGRLRAVTGELARAERAAVRMGLEGSEEVERLRRESERLTREEQRVAEELRQFDGKLDDWESKARQT